MESMTPFAATSCDDIRLASLQVRPRARHQASVLLGTLLPLLALLAMLLLAMSGVLGCAAADVKATDMKTTSGDGAAAFESPRTYAWVSSSRTTASALAPDGSESGIRAALGAGGTGGPDADARAADEARTEIDGQLAARGLTRVSPDAADVLLSLDVRVGETTRSNDPYYASALAEVVEEGTLTLGLADPASGELLWEGSARRELRAVARTLEPFRTSLEPTDRPRDWAMAETVSELLARCPALQADAPTASSASAR